jgi:hypothetical protein
MMPRSDRPTTEAGPPAAPEGSRGRAVRPFTLFAAVLAPVMIWEGVMAAVGGWADSLPMETSPEGMGRLLYAAWSWNWRNAEPFAIEACIALAPFVSLVAAWALRRTSLHPRNAAFWSLVYVALAGATFWLVMAWPSMPSMPAVVVLFAATCAAQAMAIGVAYGLQRRLHESGATPIPGYLVLWAGVILQSESMWFGFAVAAVPLLGSWWNARHHTVASMAAGDTRDP